MSLTQEVVSTDPVLVLMRAGLVHTDFLANRHKVKFPS